MIKNMLILCFLVGPAFGGWTFVSESRTSDDKGNINQKMIVRSMVDGNNGKFIFEEASGSPMTTTGNYLITNNGGETIYMVDPVNKTYSQFDVKSLMQVAGSMMNMVQGVVKMEFTDPEVKILEERAGEKVEGMPTKYRKSNTTYEMRIKVLGMKKVMDVEIVEESWTTKAFSDMAFSAWLTNDPAPTGNEDLDRVILASVKQIDGYPLKMIQTNTTTTWNKKKTKVKDKSTTRTLTVVTNLKNEKVDASQFKIPETYVQSESQEQGAIDDLKNIFNKN